MSEGVKKGEGAASFSAAANIARFNDGVASVTPITDGLKSTERLVGPQRLDIRNRRDIQIATSKLVKDEEPVFARFGNILGVFGSPAPGVVESINEFKGRERTQTGSITTTPKYYESLADWDKLDGGLLVPGSDTHLDKAKVMTLIHALSKDGPVGVLLPAADHIPPLLSKAHPDFRTVQLIVPGKDCPSNAFFEHAVAQMPDTPFVFATSGNMSKNVMKGEQPAHFDYEPLVAEFAEQNRGDITVITDNPKDARSVRRRHRYHDQRSTTILNLMDVVRDENGVPSVDADNRPILNVQRHGSMNEKYLRGVLAEHGFGAQFPPEEQRVPIRIDTKVDKIRQGSHMLAADVLVAFGSPSRKK